MINTSEDLEHFADRIAEAVSRRMDSRPLLVDRHELADLLGVSVPTIERMQRARRIPVVRIGRLVKYNPEAVMRALSD